MLQERMAVKGSMSVILERNAPNKKAAARAQLIMINAGKIISFNWYKVSLLILLPTESSTGHGREIRELSEENPVLLRFR